MRARHPLASPLSPKIRFAFTDHPTTVWAGAILRRLYVELLGPLILWQDAHAHVHRLCAAANEKMLAA